jgi:predicted unusual protein kinase regulating ubiquinone biosynthesis (AarF/ABC1/UbiB family)
LGDLFFSPERRAARREVRLTRAARDLAAVLGDLKGAFVKAGQFASLRIDMLPAQAREALASLQDRVPPLPLDVVRRVVEADLGAALETLYSRFDPVPLGTASIAQVHRAALPDGREVAVKVQHPWLEESLQADLGVIRIALAGFSLLRGRGRLDQRRVFEEFAAGLAEELDFEREAKVATEIAANLAQESQIVVPEIVTSHSARHVLTMRYQPAVPILDRAALARLGVAPGEVLGVLARAYAKQVFVDGLFHADPHPGNLFVLEESGATSRPRVLFVDFGLSKRLDPTLRRELRRGIYALLQRDLEAFLSGMERMGMIAPGAELRVRAAVSAMFARIGEGGGAPLAMSGRAILSLKDEAKVLLQSTEGLHLPNELLLYAKTLSYLFQLGAELDPSVDLMRLSVPFLLRFLADGS